jgi:ubiquinone biosynthesis protein
MTGLGRLWHIHATIRRFGLREFLKGQPSNDPRPRGERLRLALEHLGPVFIKFGQALSTRPDIVPPDIAVELAKLQDRVPPFPVAEARAIVERSLGRPIADLFAEFEDTPIAAASVAQVHGARLFGDDGGPGMPVVVKIIRPGIEAQVRKDIALLHTLAAWAERLSPMARRVRPRAVVAEFESILIDELDLMREGANCSQLRRNWLGNPLIYHPVVFWDFTRPDVLVMERIEGISIRELDRLRGLGVDFQVLAERGVEIFFKQTFRDNFFHADMHPGNIFVDARDPAQPSYLAVDFGIVGSLTPQDQRYLAENFLAFFNRDYRRIAELHVESEWIPPDTRVEAFEAAIRTVCEPIFQRPLKDISFGFFLLRLFQIARRFNYQVQPQLVLLQKTLLQVEGLGRQLYDELDLWKTAKPIMEDWMRARLGPGALMEKARYQLPLLTQSLPLLVERSLRALERGEGWAGPAGLRQQQALLRAVENNGRRSRWMIAAGSLLLSAAVVLPAVLDGAVPAWALGGLLGLALLAAWRGLKRSET